MKDKYEFDEENEVEEVYHYGFSKLKIVGNYIGRDIAKVENNIYSDSFGNTYTKNYRNKTLKVEYTARDNLRNRIFIKDFKEGDYGLWLERVPPYYIENGNIICKTTRKKDSPENIKSENENSYLELEERIIEDFLWIQANDKLLFPETKEELSHEENSNLDSKMEAEQNAISLEKSPVIVKEEDVLENDDANLLDINISVGKAGKAGKGKKMFVTTGAKLKCSFGQKAGSLTATVAASVAIDGSVQATIMDFAPMANISAFGKCKCMGYPPTAAATAANKGRLKPMPCIPGTAAPWSGGSEAVNIFGQAALLENSKLVCSYGGQIQISDVGQKIAKGK